jgi:hypothetical protein
MKRKSYTDEQVAYALRRAELHSNDTDFSRFPGLRWINPLSRNYRVLEKLESLFRV